MTRILLLLCIGISIGCSSTIPSGGVVISNVPVPIKDVDTQKPKYSPEITRLLDLHIRNRTAYSRFDSQLVINDKLMNAAQKHANWMASNQNLNHRQGWFGKNLVDRVNDENYNYIRIGENIAYGQDSPDIVMADWMSSPGHKSNILGNFSEVGFGIATASNGQKYWCVVFGSRARLAALNDPSDNLEKPVYDIKFIPTPAGRDGWEERESKFIKWLAPSVRIRSPGGMGSGTIIYFDPDTRYCYIISCGHLFGGKSMTTEQGLSKNLTVKVDVWYQNNKKLDEYKTYIAEVLCYENFRVDVWDVSLLRVKIDWNMEWYLPIAPKDIKLNSGDRLHSLGCDGGKEVAHYLIKYLEEQSRGSVTELVSDQNNPRGGRSGGGVMTDNGELIAICSRGDGRNAYWTSLNQIYKLLEREKQWSWLLDVRTNYIRKFPIIDKKHPNMEFPKNYIPLP